jgi:SepF-like predicted cell division protein (DUF552 family)
LDDFKGDTPVSLFEDLFHKKKQSKEVENPEEVAFLGEEEDDIEEYNPDKESENEELTLLEVSDGDETYEVVEREIHPEKIICPDCGGITLEGLEFCDKCGGELL